MDALDYRRGFHPGPGSSLVKYRILPAQCTLVRYILFTSFLYVYYITRKEIPQGEEQIRSGHAPYIPIAEAKGFYGAAR